MCEICLLNDQKVLECACSLTCGDVLAFDRMAQRNYVAIEGSRCLPLSVRRKLNAEKRINAWVAQFAGAQLAPAMVLA